MRPGSYVRPRPHACKRVARGLGLALGLDLLSLFLVFFFFLGFFSMFFEVLGSSLRYIKVVNRVSKTRFPCGRHMEKYATLDVIRPWKSSF